MSRGPAPRRPQRVLALTVLLLGVAGLLGLGPAGLGYATAAPAASSTGPAVAPVPAAATDPAILSLGAVTPSVTGPGVPVTVTGTVTSRSGQALTDASVRVLTGGTSVVTRAQVQAWATSTAGLTGQEVGTARVGPVAAGASAAFTVTVPAGRLSLGRSFGVVPLAVQVRDPATSTSEVLRTFVGWQRTKEYEPLRLAVVAPVTLSPDAALFDSDAARRQAAWQDQLAPTGRIARMLDGTDVDGPGGPVPVTWAVDPAVLGPNASPGASSTDPLVPVVLPLQTRLAAGAGRHTLWALPQSDPDLAATLPANPTDPTVRREVQASTGLGSVLGVPVTTGVAWPVDGSFQAPREANLAQAYEGLGVTALLGSVSALPVAGGYSGQAPRRSPGGTTLLAWDDVLSRLSLETTTPAQGAATAQRVVAETAAMVTESAGVSRSFLLAIPRTADPDPRALRQVLGALAQSPWVQMATTSELQQRAATQDPVASMSAGTWDADHIAGPPQIDAARLARIAEERHMVTEVATVLGDNGTAFRTQWSTVLDQLVSVRWRADPAALTALDSTVTQAAAGATREITVADQTTNFLADEGTLQVTVLNGLGVAVDGVRLVLQPANPRLRIVAQPDPIRIEAGSRAVVPVRAEALAAGLVPVTATITTADGTPIGAPGAITVRANPPGYSFYIVGGAVVLLILVIGTVRTLRRPRSAPAAIPPVTAPGAEEDGGPPAPGPPEAADPLPGPEDPAVASAGGAPSGSPGLDRTARRMTDDRS